MNLLTAIQSLLRIGYTIKFQRNGPANNQLTLIKDNVQVGCSIPEFRNDETDIMDRLALLANDDAFIAPRPELPERELELGEPETIDVGLAIISWFAIGLVGGIVAGLALGYSLNLFR